QTEIVIGIVKNDFGGGTREDVAQRVKVFDRERVDNEGVIASGKLQQANAVGIAVITGGLGIRGEQECTRQTFAQGCELGLRLNVFSVVCADDPASLGCKS
ncbi:MAG TPA: hypothetical protein VM100_12065, partial [Longimicrobiales bacterium]|nr:hypothetical protein [Longimicrobiales bacterium]